MGHAEGLEDGSFDGASHKKFYYIKQYMNIFGHSKERNSILTKVTLSRCSAFFQ